MSVVSGTVLTFSAVGNREDLVDLIYNISPTDTPFLGTINDNKAYAVKHEWQTDSLASAGANAQLEGDDFTYSTPSFTSRVDNMCQISYKTLVVSGTQDAVSKAGRTTEMAYQLVKKAKELKRDMEYTLTQNQAKVTGNSTTPRQARSLEAWYTTNVQRGSGGASGSTSTAATDGTQRPLTESMLKTALQQCWTQGGEPNLILCGPFNKQVISSFAGNVTRTDNNSNDRTLNTAIDIYVSDFGNHPIVASRFSRDRTLHVLTSDLFAVSYLRPMRTLDLSATGDATKSAMLVEYTLECRNEAGSAVVADLTIS